MRPVRLCLLVALLISASLLAPLEFARPVYAQAAATFAENPCPFTLSNRLGQQEGKTYRCGMVTVPQNHSQPDGKTLQIAVAVFKSTAAKPQADPVIYLEGGPGGFTLVQASDYMNSFEQLLANRDVILFDQRGVGYSTPSLYCPELTDLYYKLLGEVNTAEESAKQQTQVTLACRKRLVDQGINLSVFNSTQDAADVESIRQALGYPTLNVYGISYGTRLALTVMRDYPKSVRSSVIDSVVPLEADMIAGYIPYSERVFKQLWDACAADAKCNAAYPNLEKVFYDTVDKLNNQPLTVKANSPIDGQPHTVVVDGNALISFLFDTFYLTDYIPTLPALIYSARDGKVQTIAALLIVFADENKTLSLGMYFSVDCPESAAYTDLNTVTNAANGVPSEVQAADMPTNESEFDICNAWGTGKAPAIEHMPVKSDIPTLVMAASFDPVTPPVYAKQVAAALSHSSYVEIPNSGHGASLSGDCPFNLVMAFINNPTAKLDASCVDQIGPPQFVTNRNFN